MAEFVVNVVLIVTVLVLLAACAVRAGRRRRSERRERAAEWRLILATLTGTAAPHASTAPGDDGQPARASDDDGGGIRPDPTAAAPQQPDATIVAALLDLLQDQRPARRGILANLATSPRSVWSAGTRAGQTVGRRMVAEQRSGPSAEADRQHYRHAAGEPSDSELRDIDGHNPVDAHREDIRCAATVGEITNTTCPPELSDDAASIEA